MCRKPFSFLCIIIFLPLKHYHTIADKYFLYSQIFTKCNLKNIFLKTRHSSHLSVMSWNTMRYGVMSCRSNSSRYSLYSLFLILVDLNVMSRKLNSSQSNVLIISWLSGFVMSDEFLIKLFLLYYVLIELLIHPKAMLWYCKRPCFRMQKHAFCNAVCRLLYCIYSIFLLASAVIAFGLAIIICHLFNQWLSCITFNRNANNNRLRPNSVYSSSLFDSLLENRLKLTLP